MNSSPSFWLPAPLSTLAPQVDSLFYFILYVSIFFFILIVACSAYFVIRYRRKSGEEPGLTSGKAHNVPLEVVWTVIPTIILMVIFVWGFEAFIKFRVIPKDSIEIKVTGQRWFWNFDYDAGFSSTNELVVPVNRPVHLLMSSTDVIHSMFIPSFRVKQDVLPNRYSQLWFEATETGEYHLFCTEYCGTNHSEMIGKVRVLSTADYLVWEEKQQAANTDLSPVDLGAKLYNSKTCFTCHSLDGSTLIGPSFKDRFGKTAQFTDGSSARMDENYMRESILNPQSKIVKGYAPVMPTFQGLLTDREIDALIAYIKSLN